MMHLKNNPFLAKLRQNFHEAPPPFMIPWKTWRRVIIVCVFFSVFLIVLLKNIQIGISQSQSLPHKIFICGRGIITRRGDIVSIKNHPTAYFGNIHYAKRLVGLPGDRIVIHKNKVYINGPKRHNHLIGPLLQKTKEGKRLHPIKTTTIPKGYVFVATDHPRSFDSRYEEFGLVKQENIWGKCIGLFPLEFQAEGEN